MVVFGINIGEVLAQVLVWGIFLTLVVVIPWLSWEDSQPQPVRTANDYLQDLLTNPRRVEGDPVLLTLPAAEQVAVLVFLDTINNG